MDVSTKYVGEDSGPRPDVHERFGWDKMREDFKSMRSGTVPWSVSMAVVIGVICGIAAYLYYTALEWLLEIFWLKLPQGLVVDNPIWPENLYWLWIPIVCLTFAGLVGLSIEVLGFPGDLAYTVKCVHEFGYVDMGHTPSMVVASQFSIIAGASLGPEAPLVAICAAIAGWVSRNLFKHTQKNLIRKHTLCGMACALAAFFGVPLGGSLFALEINHRLGYEYVEHAMVAVTSGTTCLAVFRGLAGLPIGPIWQIEVGTLPAASAGLVGYGFLLGLFGASIAAVFTNLHGRLGNLMNTTWRLKDKPVKLAVLGGIVIACLGVLVPHSMFWGEYEFQSIASLGSTPLPHVWPTSGLTSLGPTSALACLTIGVAKLVAISFTVWGGFRGGYIFPFFAAGAAFGRAINFTFPAVPPTVACLCIAAGINVAVTRTAFATSIILVALSGQVNSASPVLAASLASIFSTYYMPFIRAQQGRFELLESQLHAYKAEELLESGPSLSSSDLSSENAPLLNIKSGVEEDLESQDSYKLPDSALSADSPIQEVLALSASR
uniref:Chloride channel protein n=2 Tax=Rhodosorus marinus TaxID=101924 RepID=A0A7S0BQK1_9RHOD|mmetsp:Transcript_4309/g.6108  ORF Transcript_4309/g.6108 Transcript_4309/m.6108 type:complete len:549 (+) Transcript_4309:184-1830(+)|eukprot:CAMPEP_0184749106 /NCGR_PEP_ID=MMETSP0315-20130426/25658_1 /TAXON_ID=101924 /ORGANISM="Rhodosorus marinus, Strain UTEX LB 2760" /LENGTH=548 /DNA_ID=CAMNT_0027225619 /DNA_START=106 /DNA_END=1752 /DNA_ORIENTATION=-